jgi:hypothetical protein
MICNPNTAVTIRTRNVLTWTAHDERRNEWLAEVVVRRSTGILYLVHRYAGERPAQRVLHRDACRYGHLSPRPYQLGQACDGSITGCVLALFSAFCEARKLDPNALLRRAYADERDFTEQDFAEIRLHADWERTAYPEKWDRHAIEGLLESLREVNYHSLAEVVQNILDAEAS